jgi:hypothetical protein
MSDKKPNWLLLKECAEKLTKEGKAPFTRKQLIECVQSKYPDRLENSLNPMIQAITKNLKGGAPGGIGKDILISVDWGLLQLNPEKEEIHIKELPKYKQSSNTISQVSKVKEDGKTSENKIRDKIMSILYCHLGEKGTWEEKGKKARFKLQRQYGDTICKAEVPLKYELPNGHTLSHSWDILIIDASNKNYVSIEIKHESAVTDQFKCRSYDMMHTKATYSSKVFGIMIYVKAGKGISIERAKKICYSFEHFFGIKHADIDVPPVWDELISVISDFLKPLE